MQVEILALEIKEVGAHPDDVVAGHHAVGRLEPSEFTLRLEATTTPGGQLIGQVPQHSLEIDDRREVRTNVG